MFYDRFIELCRVKYGKKPNALAKDIGISSGTITEWKNGKKPTLESLVKVSQFFEVTIDYLIFGTQNLPQDLSIDESRLIEVYRTLSYEDKIRVSERAELLAESYARATKDDALLLTSAAGGSVT